MSQSHKDEENPDRPRSSLYGGRGCAWECLPGPKSKEGRFMPRTFSESFMAGP